MAGARAEKLEQCLTNPRGPRMDRKLGIPSGRQARTDIEQGHTTPEELGRLWNNQVAGDERTYPELNQPSPLRSTVEQ